MDTMRRTLLRRVAASALLPLLGAGLLAPRRVMAAEWNRGAFTAHTVGDALRAFGAGAAVDSRDIVINGPEIAENGAKVEIDITSNVAGSRSIAVFADKNPMPLCAALEFSGSALPFARLQLKLAESTRLRAVVKTGEGKTYVAMRDIKVTLGGCGD